MNDWLVDRGLISLLLLAGLAAGTGLPTMQAYLVVAAVYAIVLSFCLVRGTLGVRYGREVLYPTVFLWALFLFVFVLHPTGDALLRTAAFVVASGINLFVVPGTFSREQFVDGLSVVATAIAAITIPLAYPRLVAGRKGVGVWQLNHHVAGTDITTPVLTSLFWNPNYLAALSVFGLIALGGFARTERRRWIAIAFGLICLVGLAASQGRAAVLALAGAAAVFLAYRVGNTRTTLPVVILGVIGGIVLFVLTLGLSFGIDLPALFFNHRRGLWNAAIRAIGERPLLGWGLIDTQPILAAHGGPIPGGNTPGTHNSYLRMFLQTGFVGGVTYLGLCGGALVRSINATRDGTTVSGALLALLAAFLTIQLFNGSTLFGLSFVSLFGALIVGFSQHPDRRIDPPRIY